MPRSRGTRLVAKRLLDATAEDSNLDYFERFAARKRLKNDSKNQASTSDVPQQQPTDRASRAARREAAKLGQTLVDQGQAVSRRQGIGQWSEDGDSENDSGTAAEDDEDDDDGGDEDAGPDGVDHARITQAFNQARSRTLKPTINGIGSRHKGKLPQDAEASSDDEEGSQEELFESQSPDGEEATPPRNPNGRSRSRHGANGNALHQKHQQNHGDRDRLTQKDNKSASSPDEDESEAESASEISHEIAEDTVFVEAPEQDEATVTVKVVINSMGGIFKTLQHPVWTGSTHWIDEFESDDDDDGQKTCKTSAGKALMGEIQRLNNVLEEAANPPDDPFDDDHGLTISTTAYLRTKGVDVRQHLTRIAELVDEICSRKLLPISEAGSQHFATQLVKKRRALLRDMSCRLIPMLIITVKKACGICQPGDNRSKTTLHLDCFRLQFFLRPLAWADRLHRALERGLEQWPEDDEAHNGADKSHEGGRDALDAEKKARSTLASQLDALYSAVRKAEKEIHEVATQAEREEREAEVRRQERERKMERQREIAAKKQREEEEQKEKDERAFQAFFEATRALRSQPDPLKRMWDQDQAALPEQFRATSTVRATPVGSSPGQGQRTTGPARSRGGPSRHARFESGSDSDDPFSDNYRPRSVTNRNASSNGDRARQNPFSGLGSPQQARNASGRWSEEEEKIMIKAIRYKRNYDVVSMAQKLRRSEDDVARKAAFLKQGFREVYTQRGREIPAWAL